MRSHAITGLTKGFLSRVERDMTSPSVASLITLCDVLSISVGSLFEAPDVQVVRGRHRPAHQPGRRRHRRAAAVTARRVRLQVDPLA